MTFFSHLQIYTLIQGQIEFLNKFVKLMNDACIQKNLLFYLAVTETGNPDFPFDKFELMNPLKSRRDYVPNCRIKILSHQDPGLIRLEIKDEHGLVKQVSNGSIAANKRTRS